MMPHTTVMSLIRVMLMLILLPPRLALCGVCNSYQWYHATREPASNTNITGRQLTAVSNLRCAEVCSSDPDCTHFGFSFHAARSCLLVAADSATWKDTDQFSTKGYKMYRMSLPAVPPDEQNRRNEAAAAKCRSPGYYYPADPATCSCYKLYTRRLGWTEARRTCEGDGGHLVTLHDKWEYRAVQEAALLQDSGIGGDVWLGGTDKEEEGVWRWLDGTPVSPAIQELWGDQEPNNGRMREHWMTLVVSKGTLNDQYSGWQLPFLCQIDL